MRIYVPSLGRPENVRAMQALAGPTAHIVWLVSEDEADAYIEAGARVFITGPRTKSEKLNQVLDRYGDEWCVFSDDDCQEMWRLDKHGGVKSITLGEAAYEFVRIGVERNDRLVCLSGSTNARFMNRSITNWGMTVGWFFAVAPHVPCRFDTSLYMHEDSDFAAQVFDRFGRIARVNWIMGKYRMGGRDSHFRYDDLDTTMGAVASKWPGLFHVAPGPRLRCNRVV